MIKLPQTNETKDNNTSPKIPINRHMDGNRLFNTRNELNSILLVMAYSDKQKTEIINTICERVSKGEALRTILKEKDQIDSVTFYKWIDADEEKIKQYTRATKERADSIFEDVLDIADSQGSDIYIDKEGNEHVNHDNINRARLRVDARKWALGKMNPKKYGDKIEQEITGKGINITVSSKEEQDKLNDIGKEI